MRYFLLLIVVGSMYSCRTPLNCTITKVPEPFVKLKNGTTIKAEAVTHAENETKEEHIGKVKMYGTKFRPRMIADGKEYKATEVAAFSDGNASFTNLGERNFAFRTGDGAINTYVSFGKWDPFGGYDKSLRTFNIAYQLSGPGLKDLAALRVRGKHGKLVRPNMHFYIQKGEDNKAEKFCYKSLKEMIPANAPGYSWLTKFNHTRLFSSIAAVAGFGMFIAGNNLVAAANNKTPTDNGMATTGSVIAIAGGGITVTSLIIKNYNHRKLNKALYEYNRGR